MGVTSHGRNDDGEPGLFAACSLPGISPDPDENRKGKMREMHVRNSLILVAKKVDFHTRFYNLIPCPV